MRRQRQIAGSGYSVRSRGRFNTGGFVINFAGASSLSPSIGVVRGTSGTFLNSTGKILGLARTNFIRNSVMAGATVGVVGGGGSLATNYLIYTARNLTTEVLETGANYSVVKISGTANSSGNYQIAFDGINFIPAATGQVWTDSCYLMLVAGSASTFNSIFLSVNENTSAGAYVIGGSSSELKNSLSATEARYEFTRTLSGGGTVGNIQPLLALNVTSGNTYDITLKISSPQLEQKPSITDYIPTYGSAVTTYDGGGINQARFDYNPSTLSPEGLMVERAATNFFRATNNANDAWWLKFNTTTAAADQLAPDGTISMVKATENTANSSHVPVYKNITVTAGHYWVMSAYVKFAGRKSLVLKGRSTGFTNQVYARFDVQAGTYTSSGVSGAGVVSSYGVEATNVSGVYRIWLAGRTSPTDTAITFEYDFVNDSGLDVYTGDGTSGIYFWGMNLIVAATQPIISSYIENTGTGADVSRSGDSPSSSNLVVIGANPTDGTTVIEFKLAGFTTSQRIFGFGTFGSTLNRMEVITVGNNARLFVNVAGTPTIDINTAASGAVLQIGLNKVALRSKGSNWAISVNGGAEVTNTTSAVPSVATMFLGVDTNNGNQMDGWIRKITNYPTSNTNTQQLSAL